MRRHLTAVLGRSKARTPSVLTQDSSLPHPTFVSNGYYPFKRKDCYNFFKVRQVIWSQDDSKIISCGMDGAVYEWNVTSYKREGESVLKSCSYTGVSVSPDSRTTFAVGSDRTLKEICDSQVGF